jgi:CDP-diacylglycerol--serine O-phosphatidyltransferase
MQSHAREWMASHLYLGNAIISVAIIAVALMMVTDMRMFSLKLKNFRIGENFERYLLLIAAVLFVGVFGVEGFAYTIILYFILSACMLPLKRQKS